MLALLIPGVGMGGGGGAAPEPVVETYSGGWEVFDAYASELEARKEREKRRKALLAELEGISDEADREIAELLHEKTDAEERQAEKERLRGLVVQIPQDEIEKVFGERVSKAYERAIEKATHSALEALVREAKRAQEEEEFLLMAVLSTLH